MQCDFIIDKIEVSQGWKIDDETKQFARRDMTTLRLIAVPKGPDAEGYNGTPWEGRRAPLGAPTGEIVLGDVSDELAASCRVGDLITFTLTRET